MQLQNRNFPIWQWVIISASALVIGMIMLQGALRGPQAIISPLENPTGSMSTLPTPQPDFSMTRYFTTTLHSPNNQITLLADCSQCNGCGDIPHCSVKFPSGARMDATFTLDWSPDNQFAVICFGGTHDSPCRWWEVWDMVAGEKKETFYSPFHQWSPTELHTLVYLVQTVYISTLDQLIVFDPMTEEKIYLDVCPNWFHQRFQWACDRFPNAIVGGQISGLPDNVVVKIVAYELGKDLPYTLNEKRGSVYWTGALRISLGTVYTITTHAEGYTSDPASYTIQISNIQKYVTVMGYTNTAQAANLDFHFTSSLP